MSDGKPYDAQQAAIDRAHEAWGYKPKPVAPSWQQRLAALQAEAIAFHTAQLEAGQKPNAAA